MTSQRKTDRKRKSLVICICGMAGSGKSTLAKRLAEKYGLRYFSGGNALRALALKEGCQSLKRGWWESEEGLRFLNRRNSDKKFDKSVDKELLAAARRGDVILDSWTMPWLLRNGFKIWLEASAAKRAERISKRDKIAFKEALAALKRKEEETKAIYKSLYGFSLGDDYAPFDFILDTENLNSKEVFQVLCTVIDNVVISSEKHKG